MNTTVHVLSWILAGLLFALAIFMDRKGNEKLFTIFHMTVRLLFILILISGILLLRHYFGSAYLKEAIVKSLTGLWVIVAMEMVLVRTKKGEETKIFWIQLLIAFVITVLLGSVYLR